MSQKSYWFPARPARNGWKLGWGLPSVWQGWAVYVVFVLSLIGGPILLAPFGQLVLLGYLCSLIVLVLGITAWKGEPL
jgi:hypothetical protein